MSEQPTPSPEELRRSRRVLLAFLAMFVLSGIGVTIFGFQVVARVKATARESDAALRTVAWSLISAADEDGAFPTDSDVFSAAMLDSDRGPDAPLDGSLSADTSDWPTSRDAAMAESASMPLGEALEIVEVAWPPTPDLPPVLSVGGRPSGLVADGPTIDAVNRWLRAAAARLATDAGGAPEDPVDAGDIG